MHGRTTSLEERPTFNDVNEEKTTENTHLNGTHTYI
jgi:hypothetical protein